MIKTLFLAAYRVTSGKRNRSTRVSAGGYKNPRRILQKLDEIARLESSALAIRCIRRERRRFLERPAVEGWHGAIFAQRERGPLT